MKAIRNLGLIIILFSASILLADGKECKHVKWLRNIVKKVVTSYDNGTIRNFTTLEDSCLSWLAQTNGLDSLKIEQIDTLFFNIPEYKHRSVFQQMTQAISEHLDPHSRAILKNSQPYDYLIKFPQFAPFDVVRINGQWIIARVFQQSLTKKKLVVGSTLVQLEGRKTDNLAYRQIMSRLEKARSPSVTWRTNGELYSLFISRQSVSVDLVSFYTISEEIGVIKILSFYGSVYSNFKKQYNSLVEQGVRKIIIDLRDNPGGYINEALSVLKLLIPGERRPLLYARYRTRIERFVGNGNSLLLCPVVVIINERSASAAEIMAGVIQKSGRGVSTGKKTFGKGLIQQHYNNEWGRLKLAIGTYYLPDASWVQREWYEPINDINTARYYLGAYAPDRNGKGHERNGVVPDYELNNTTLDSLPPKLCEMLLTETEPTKLFARAFSVHHQYLGKDSLTAYIADNEHLIFKDFTSLLMGRDSRYRPQLIKSNEVVLMRLVIRQIQIEAGLKEEKDLSLEQAISYFDEAEDRLRENFPFMYSVSFK